MVGYAGNANHAMCPQQNGSDCLAAADNGRSVAQTHLDENTRETDHDDQRK